MENSNRKFLATLKFYDYKFPANLIAQKPAEPRDSAKLLVYKRSFNKIYFDKFKNLTEYLPKNSVLVFNQTKVLPARLTLKKETGGKLQILYLGNNGETIKVMANKKLAAGSKIILNKKMSFQVIKKEDKYYILKPDFEIKNLYKILEKYGEMPIPPYIKNSPLSQKELKEKYQTVFSKFLGSVAAPTASLHFTKKLIQKLKQSGHEVKFVTLHVNLGTFAPLTEENLKNSKLHEEYYEIDKETARSLNQAKKSGRPIIAVGTTVARTLESACEKNIIKKLSGKTDIFIKPPYKFKFLNGLITNFHVPQSSLLMLVSALVGRKKLFQLYQKAIQKNFRLFSFGDGMLIY